MQNHKTPVTVKNILHVVFLTLASLCLLVIIMRFAQIVLKPLVVASLLTLILLPIKRFYERKLKYPSLAALLTVTTILIPITAACVFLVRQVNIMLADIPPIQELISQTMSKINQWLGSLPVPLESDLSINETTDGGFSEIANYLSSGISISGNILFMILLSLIATFFFLWYTERFKEFVIIQFARENRHRVFETFNRMEEMLVKYLSGMMYVMLIMAVLNSFGLWLIGVKFPILWGCLAALLMVIPYFGTIVGSLLPIIYVLGSGGELLTALWIAIFFVVLQQIEGNVITPKIVGSSINVNPLVVIVAMLIGGLIWGLVGVILALPVSGMMRILLDSFNPLKPLAVLLSSDIHSMDSPTFRQHFDDEKYRISSMFGTADKEQDERDD